MNKSQKLKLESFRQISTKILYLHHIHPDWTQGKIARILEVLPQHVSNTINHPSKSPKETFKK